MIYADYEFYKTEYFGVAISEADFPRLARRASSYIDYITMGRASGYSADDAVVGSGTVGYATVGEQADMGLTDEVFNGAVWALAVPKAVIDLSAEIAEWDKKNQPSSFTSESFGGYSYSKATNASGVAVGWQDVFKSRLNQWRRIGGI